MEILRQVFRKNAHQHSKGFQTPVPASLLQKAPFVEIGQTCPCELALLGVGNGHCDSGLSGSDVQAASSAGAGGSSGSNSSALALRAEGRGQAAALDSSVTAKAFDAVSTAARDGHWKGHGQGTDGTDGAVDTSALNPLGHAGPVNAAIEHVSQNPLGGCGEEVLLRRVAVLRLLF